ncbi:MAG TPA: GNAT family N-acetyltransferase, partial [Pilimelia sp.]|nr:GNAT family N-acetyltransferase [Pilimelia sp.]
MNADDRAAAAGFVVVPLADDHVSAVVALCRVALDLPDDAAEAAEIVLRLREQPAGPGARASTGPPRRLVGHVALRPAWPSPGDPDDPGGSAVIGAALGSVAQRDPTVGHVDLVAVHPAARRAGIARALLA